MNTWRNKVFALAAAGILLSAAAVPFISKVGAEPSSEEQETAFQARNESSTKKLGGLLKDANKTKLRNDLLEGFADRLGVSTSKAREALQDGTQTARSQRGSQRSARSSDGSGIVLAIKATAKELNVSDDKLRQALEGSLRSALEDLLDDGVKDGKIAKSDRQSLMERFEFLADRLEERLN